MSTETRRLSGQQKTRSMTELAGGELCPPQRPPPPPNDAGAARRGGRLQWYPTSSQMLTYLKSLELQRQHIVHRYLLLELLVQLFDLRLHRLLLLVRLFALHAVDAPLELLDLVVFVVDDLLLLQRVVVQHVDLAVQVPDGRTRALDVQNNMFYYFFTIKWVAPVTANSVSVGVTESYFESTFFQLHALIILFFIETTNLYSS